MRLVLSLIFITLLVGTTIGQAEPFRTYVDPKAGTSAHVPSNWRAERMPAGETREGRVFISPNGNSLLAIYTKRTSPRDRAQAADEPAAAGERITYRASGRNWFVRSGFNGDDRIFYRKVIFSCGGRVAHLLAFDYPASEKRAHDRLVTVTANSLRAGRGSEAC